MDLKDKEGLALFHMVPDVPNSTTTVIQIPENTGAWYQRDIRRDAAHNKLYSAMETTTSSILDAVDTFTEKKDRQEFIAEESLKNYKFQLEDLYKNILHMISILGNISYSLPSDFKKHFLEVKTLDEAIGKMQNLIVNQQLWTIHKFNDLVKDNSVQEDFKSRVSLILLKFKENLPAYANDLYSYGNSLKGTDNVKNLSYANYLRDRNELH